MNASCSPVASQARVTHQPGLWITILLPALAFFTGCASSTANLSPQIVQPGFELSIAMYTTAGKHTYMTLDPDGQLSFAGGKDASLRQTKPITTLSDEQIAQVWQLVVSSDMIQTKNQLFKSPETIAFDVQIDPGQGYSSKSFHVVDDAIPASVHKLQDMLFEWQAAVNYRPMLPAKQ